MAQNHVLEQDLLLARVVPDVREFRDVAARAERACRTTMHEQATHVRTPGDVVERTIERAQHLAGDEVERAIGEPDFGHAVAELEHDRHGHGGLGIDVAS